MTILNTASSSFTSTEANTAIALTIAGSDSGGGAGIQADLKAFSANGAYGASVLTAITAQNTHAVTAVHAVPIEVVQAQIAAVLEDLDVKAIKIGMLFSPELVETVARALEEFEGCVVLDPVMIAKSGDTLLQDDAVSALIEELIPRADLLTPNLPEAAKLLRVAGPFNSNDPQLDLEQQCKALQDLGAKNVLLKGGHAQGKTCIDTLLGEDGRFYKFTAPRINTKNTHGTGCTYSSSITAQLARGASIVNALSFSHQYLHTAIKRSDELNVGSGHGPVHHFHAYWQKA